MSKKMVARLGLVSFIPFCLALMAGFEQSAKPSPSLPSYLGKVEIFPIERTD